MVEWWWLGIALAVGIMLGLSVPGPVRRGEEPFTDGFHVKPPRAWPRRHGSNPNPPNGIPDNPRPLPTPPPPRNPPQTAVHLHLNGPISADDVAALKALVDAAHTGLADHQPIEQARPAPTEYRP